MLSRSSRFLQAGQLLLRHLRHHEFTSQQFWRLSLWFLRIRSTLQHHKPDILHRWAEYEHRCTAVICSLLDTRPGQVLLSSVLPLAVVVQLFPSRFRCLAYDPCFQSQLMSRQDPLLLSLKLPAVLSKLLEEVNILLRGLYLAMLFLPVVLTAPLAFYANIGREQWTALLRWTLERAGPAFIKWGQWASTRPDLFPSDVCSSLEQLQTNAPAHYGRHSRLLVEAAFGRPVHHIFDVFEDAPVASGSIAQIHQARLSTIGASVTGCKPGTVVAVKVRHPGVTTLMERDFVLMERAAKACSHIPFLEDLRLDESIRQFGGPLKEQLDLAIEAQHMLRFKHNFRLWGNVSFPTPMYPLVAPDVLVESFEEGDLISAYVNMPKPGYKHRFSLAQTGLNLYLQMLFKDNFIHADLHPGNILVKEVNPKSLKGLARMLTGLFQFEFKPRLILLDTGMTAELSPTDQRNLINFFAALTKQDGAKIGRTILQLSEQHTCKDPDAFVGAMKDMFDRLDPVTISKHTGDVFKDMIETLRQHQVTLKSTISTVVVTTLILEGWSNKLDPDLHILDTVRNMLATDWADRISVTVDKMMAAGAVAVV